MTPQTDLTAEYEAAAAEAAALIAERTHFEALLGDLEGLEARAVAVIRRSPLAGLAEEVSEVTGDVRRLIGETLAAERRERFSDAQRRLAEIGERIGISAPETA
jgi:hypothetical protein